MVVREAEHFRSCDTRDTATESTPLLTRDDSQASADRHVKKKLSPFAIIGIIVMLLAFLQCGDVLIDSPMTRIIESISCYRYWEQRDPSQLLTDADHAGPGALFGTHEYQCKEDAIQAEVAMIRSWQFFFEGIPSLALAVPFGWLQDRYGRRPFVIIGMLSFLIKLVWIMVVLWFWQSFELRWTWLSSLHALMMAGSPGITALYYTIIADITMADERATTFLRLGAINLGYTFVIPPLSARLMTFNPWIPFSIGIGLTAIGCSMTPLIPETLHHNRAHDELDTPPAVEAIPGPPDMATDVLPVSSDFAQRLFLDLKETSSFLWADYRVPLTIAPFLVHILFLAMTPLLVQYASKRYALKLADATLYVTIRAAVSGILLFVILPYASSLLMDHFGFSGKHKDLAITKASMTILAAGWIMIGLSPSLWLFNVSQIVTSLGIGALFTLRSLLTSLVPQDQIARAYSVVCVIDTLGFMFGLPVMAELFKVGMHIGGSGIGLPFFVLGGITLLFAVLLMFVRLRKDELGAIDALDDDSL